MTATAELDTLYYFHADTGEWSTRPPAPQRPTQPRLRVVSDCARCQTDPYVPHDNCLYGGRAMGHSRTHCTADACY